MALVTQWIRVSAAGLLAAASLRAGAADEERTNQGHDPFRTRFLQELAQTADVETVVDQAFVNDGAQVPPYPVSAGLPAQPAGAPARWA